jgi:hypothetical protein
MASPDALGTTAFDMIDAPCFSALSLLFRSSAWSFLDLEETFDVGLNLSCCRS